LTADTANRADRFAKPARDEHAHVSGALPDGEAEIELRGVSKRFTARGAASRAS
jgi:hypothetical protein